MSPASYRPSAWHDPLDGPIGQLMAAYPFRVPRHDLAAVERLADVATTRRPSHHIAVVGSNGKTSTATFLSRLLGRTVAVGLYTSPHIASWTERVLVANEPCDPETLLQTLRRIHAVAQSPAAASPELRFFDLLTLAADELLTEAGVEVAIFEAGIGGRLDAVRVLHPEVVVLTSVDLEHTELLGTTRTEILREKLGIAPPGADVVAPVLGDDEERLTDVALEIAAEHGLTMHWVDVDRDIVPATAPRFMRQNLALAEHAARVAAERLPGVIPAAPVAPPAAPPSLDVRGRFEQGCVGGVPFVADVGHNPAAWEAFLHELQAAHGAQRGMLAVVALTRERPVDELAAAVARSGLFDRVIATTAVVRPTHDPSAVATALHAAGVRATAEANGDVAFRSAVSHAAAHDQRLVVFGSNYVVTDFLAWATRYPANSSGDEPGGGSAAGRGGSAGD